MTENEMMEEAPSTDELSENEAVTKPQHENESADTDYEEILTSDMEELRESFSELGADFSVTDLKNPIRVGALDSSPNALKAENDITPICSHRPQTL